MRNIQSNQAVQTKAARSRAKAEIVEAPLNWFKSAAAWLEKEIIKAAGNIITTGIYAQSIAAQIELKRCEAFDYCQNEVQKMILSSSVMIVAIENWGKKAMPQCSVIPLMKTMIFAGHYVVTMNDRYQNTLPDAPNYDNEEGLPDYTDIIQNRMDQTVQEYRIKLLKQGYAWTMWDFYNDVKTNGALDIKNKEIWNRYFAGTEIEQQPSAFIFRGQKMDPGMLGNETYSYLGTSLGVSGPILYLGGGWAHMKNKSIEAYSYPNSNWTSEEIKIISNIEAFSCWYLPNYGDTPEDHETVRQGIEWYFDNLIY